MIHKPVPAPTAEANPKLPDGLPTPAWSDEEYGVALYCGDCLEIMPRLPKVDAVVTDPPYGVKRDKGFVNHGGWGGRGKTIVCRP